MFVKIQGELRGVSKKEFTRKDGTKGYDCKVLIEVGCEPIQLPCDSSIADSYGQSKIVKGQTYDFVADYHPLWKYNQMVVKACEDVK